MKFNYKLQRLCGASYGTPAATGSGILSSSSKGSNIVFTSDGNNVLSPVGNRIQVLDLLHHSCRTLPIEARSNIRRIALSPNDDRLLIVVDVNSYAMLINYHRGVILHRFKFKRTVRVMKFSPDGSKFAVSFGKGVQVWNTPGIRREFAPMVLHRKYTGLVGDVTTLDWSSDSTVLIAGGKDCQARVWTVDTVKDYEPWTLIGHKKPLVGVHFEDRQKTLAERHQFFTDDGNTGSTLAGKLVARCYTVSEDGAICTRECRKEIENTDDSGDNKSSLDLLGNDAVDFFSGRVEGMQQTKQVHKTLSLIRHMSFMAVDKSGEVVCAGSAEPFRVCVWSVQTGKLTDVLTGHVGPVNSVPETFENSADVVCLAFRPDGNEICTGTIRGLLRFWNVEDGRKFNDRMTSDNNSSSRYFTSIAYSADGTCLLAGGNSKYVCIYEISQQILLKKFQVSFNRSLDGVLDELNSKNLADGGAVDDEHDSADENDFSSHLPGAQRADDGSRKSRVEVLTMQVAFSPTGREWSTVSTEGLHVYSLDDDMIFDPLALTEAVTPAAVQTNLREGKYGMALLMSLHLNEFALVKAVIEDTPYESIGLVVKSIGRQHLGQLTQFLSKALFRVVQSRYADLKTICDDNKYSLQFLESQANLLLGE
ncbi:WD40 repeat protein [Skeletonema marinoi]|uniref:WD40 repeat protein n=1 Tax=Skeletonema marinoi TaxID=267567 RepID=A0AAD9DI69_9STRA|nr:WD40 repeat protein [Skeletonema marinoi]